MSDRAGTRPWMSPRRAILAILAFQIAMAVVLAGNDLIRALPQLLTPSRQPALDTPVRPGDQVRRFRPGDLPDRPKGTPNRTTPLPNPGDMPSRLRFEPPEEGVALITGTIAPGDADRFADWLTGVEGLDSLRLHSPGGSVMDALAIGRSLRAADIATTMDPGDICFSACPYILAGGMTRTVSDEALVGVHQHYFGENTALPAFLAVEDIQRGQGEVMAYLDEMGVDVRVMEHALTTPPEEIYVLLPEELRDYALVTPSGETAE